jgi:nitrogen fixation protein FixH
MKVNPWPYAIALYFAIFIGAIAIWITFAVRHDDQLVRSDYYEQELKYQTDIDGQSRGARADVNVSYDSTRQLVTIALPAPVTSGSIYFYRPSDAKADRQITLDLKDGAQKVDVRNFENGLWKVRVTWIKDGAEYRHNATLVFAPTEISLR